MPESDKDHAGLERTYEAMTEELLRRARIAWTSAFALGEIRPLGRYGKRSEGTSKEVIN